MNRRSLWRAPLAVVAAAWFGACTTVSTSPTTIAAMEFDSLAYPSIVTGDTLRDSLGKAAPLHAVAFNGNGAVIANPSIRYLLLDSGVTIGAGGIVTAQARSGTANIVASANGIQTKARPLIITRRPDSVVVTGKLVDTLRYVLPDEAGLNVTAELGVRVATFDTTGGVKNTQGWLVSYQLLFAGKVVAKSDTTVASLWTTGSQNGSLVDTTDANGLASRRVRIRALGLPSAAESVVVIATVRYKGAAVRGSPVRFVIHTRPK